MKKQFPHGIDITAPGGLTALMAFHRKTFGDAVMETDEEAAAKAAAEAEAKAAADAAAAKAADEKLGEGGIKALKAEREAREAAEKRAADAEAKVQAAEDAKLSDIDRANKKALDAEDRAAKLETANARLAALAKHPVPEDYQDLVTGTDAASFEASAKKISELHARAEGKAPKPDPVPGSGDRSGDHNPAGGSIAAGREQYHSKHPKKS
ncbi:hypothetical protein [Arthrobacter sp. ok362]|uniref:hypothetical protein n=1 Tax=Arthrobacter sp. ok362 TaxID=1761745 RepID=UPI000880309B|nr:hypothetical protein [Arthrobacter sp. ok362]SDK79422.1 colicin import membrane protein [Arthrobacter sp. ok362]